MEIFFYIFSSLLIIGSLGVVLSKNPVYSVLFLIFSFLNCAGLFILLKAEFLAMLLIIVYVGAVSVLFLFVIMMIGDRISEKIYSPKIFSFAFIVSFIFFFELLWIIYLGFAKYKIPSAKLPIPELLSNTESIGSVLYTEFMLPFEISGIILFVAMVGSVVLTHRIRAGVKKQDMNLQLDRNRENSIELVKLKSGKSIYDN
jgi:NADH-quinone oxidoreductase subunit J